MRHGNGVESQQFGLISRYFARQVATLKKKKKK